MLIHASAAALGSEAVLLRGPSDAGKSDLVLRLMTRGWQLVADDQVMMAVNVI
jgi:serine kinase of HPr protein (carbohydrate metabolism regulator)